MYDANVYSEQRIDLLASLQHVLTYTQRRGRLSQQGTTMPCKQTRTPRTQKLPNLNKFESIAGRWPPHWNLSGEEEEGGRRVQARAPRRWNRQTARIGIRTWERRMLGRERPRGARFGASAFPVSPWTHHRLPFLSLSPLDFLAACCHPAAR
jgi:hypothetical protein